MTMHSIFIAVHYCQKHKLGKWFLLEVILKGEPSQHAHSLLCLTCSNMQISLESVNLAENMQTNNETHIVVIPVPCQQSRQFHRNLLDLHFQNSKMNQITAKDSRFFFLDFSFSRNRIIKNSLKWKLDPYSYMKK